MGMLLTNRPPTLPRFGGAGKGIFSTQPFFPTTPKKFHKILDAYIYIKLNVHPQNPATCGFFGFLEPVL
jgi:hypothetical protein